MPFFQANMIKLWEGWLKKRDFDSRFRGSLIDNDWHYSVIRPISVIIATILVGCSFATPILHVVFRRMGVAKRNPSQLHTVFYIIGD